MKTHLKISRELIPPECPGDLHSAMGQRIPGPVSVSNYLTQVAMHVSYDVFAREAMHVWSPFACNIPILVYSD